MIEWLCRCGITPYLKELQNEVEYIKKSVNENGICEAKVNEEQIKGISTYSGLQLEVDWKDPIRKLCDAYLLNNISIDLGYIESNKKFYFTIYCSDECNDQKR